MKKSAGILLYRKKNFHLEFFLIHPGGPFYFRKDNGVWSIPKGEFEEGEEPLQAAIREFGEETGHEVRGDFQELSPIKQKNGKVVFAWALEGEADENKVVSNKFEMEWPPKSGRKQSFPEADRAGWFGVDEAKEKINPGQAPLLDEVLKRFC